jgi:peptidoglycan hydrolase-like protein with peptidoglycan-binding domain
MGHCQDMSPDAPQSPPRPWALFVVGGTLVAVLAGTGVWWANAQRGPRQQAAVPAAAPTSAAPTPSLTAPTPTRPAAASPATKPKPKAEPKPKAKPKPKVDPNRLKPGDEGPLIAALQRRLIQLHYEPGPVDGEFGGLTQRAVWAFQHVNRVGADGVVGPKTQRALARAAAPKPFAAAAGRTRIEVSIDRQVLVLYVGGAVRLVTHVSSGNGREFCDGGRCRVARTPRGHFRVGRKIAGWRTSDLGKLYNPIYFFGPYALHGSLSVPNFPASHGCIRLPMRVAERLPGLVPVGTPVIVR